MDRRTFLTLLGAVGALSGAPGWLRGSFRREHPDLEWLDDEFDFDWLDDDDLSPWIGPQDLAVYGRDQTFEFMAAHNGSMDSGPAECRLMRLPDGQNQTFEFKDDGGVIMSFLLAPGGIVRWVAVPGNEIHGPVRIVTPEVVQAHVVGTDSRGRLVTASKSGVVLLQPG